jgi:hypothetical protein
MSCTKFVLSLGLHLRLKNMRETANVVLNSIIVSFLNDRSNDNVIDRLEYKFWLYHAHISH